MNTYLAGLFSSKDICMGLTTALRMLLAVFLGGWIGHERENCNQPAGLRTHALVCMGSALVMCISEYIMMKGSSADYTRFGAQVISGIGFLGAGTIFKSGSTVRGLTTAASLWTVAGVGLALGCGFYAGAIVTAVLMYTVLQLNQSFLRRNGHYKTLYIDVKDVDEELDQVLAIFSRFHVRVQSIEIMTETGLDHPQLRITLITSADRDSFRSALNCVRNSGGVLDSHVE